MFGLKSLEQALVFCLPILIAECVCQCAINGDLQQFRIRFSSKIYGQGNEQTTQFWSLSLKSMEQVFAFGLPLLSALYPKLWHQQGLAKIANTFLL